MYDIDAMAQEWAKLTNNEIYLYDFPREISRYMWNGWGKTVSEAAKRLLEDERKYANKRNDKNNSD